VPPSFFYQDGSHAPSRTSQFDGVDSRRQTISQIRKRSHLLLVVFVSRLHKMLFRGSFYFAKHKDRAVTPAPTTFHIAGSKNDFHSDEK